MNKKTQIKEIVNDTENQYDFDYEGYLVDMMFASEPIDKFMKLWDVEKDIEKWQQLMNMTCCEDSYESVGGDEGYLDNPPLNHERIKYLEELIVFLKSKGIEEE